MRIHPALSLAAVLLPALAAAQTNEWVRDDMSDESLWLLRTSNLAREAPRAGTLPGAPDGGSHWVMSKGDGPAYVVYFIPGRIHEVEIDTHRLAGVSGDFTLAISTDGKLYQSLDTGAVLLDTSFGWDYRLMASDQIPENATHLLVQFPEGSTAHSLSEVWIRYTWDDALVSRFLPEPVAAPSRPETLAAQSDAELQMMLDLLKAQAAQQAASEVFPLVKQTPAPAQAPAAFVAEPLRAPHAIDGAAPPQFEPVGVADISTTQVVIEEVTEEPIESAAAEPDAAPAGSEALALATLSGPAQAQALHTAPTDAEAQAPASAEDSEIQIGSEPDSTTTPAEKPDEFASKASDTTPIDVAVFEAPAETSVDTLTASAFAEIAVAADGPAGEPIRLEVAATPVADLPLESAPGSIAVAEPLQADGAEEAIVLPTFTIPVFVDSESGEPAAEPDLEPAPQFTANSVVLETGDAAAGASTPRPDQSAPAIDDAQLHDETSPALAVSPAPLPHTVPEAVKTAARNEPTPAEQRRKFDADDEPESRPTLKMKRTGPRSKSRGIYVVRG